MTENIIHEYGYSDGKIGLEAKYMLRDSILYVKISGSNHWTDYIRCIFAWPRVRPFSGQRKIALHGQWWYMARELWEHLMSEMCGHPVTDIKIIGHSLGGVVAAIMGLYFGPTPKVKITTINAPKMGNKRAVEALRTSGAELHVLYDVGDIVRKLPLFYADYPVRSKRWYDRAYGIGIAHNNKPSEWNDFPI